MEDQRPPLHFHTSEDPQPVAAGRALWQSVRRPRRGRSPALPSAAEGPYETSYPIASGYPDRDIVVR